jgi:hypothetical protein
MTGSMKLKETEGGLLGEWLVPMPICPPQLTWIFPGYGAGTRNDKPKTVCVSRDTFSKYKNKLKNVFTA